MKSYTVNVAHGHAAVKDANGKITAVKNGDVLSHDAILLSSDEAKLVLTLENQQMQAEVKGEVRLSDLPLTAVSADLIEPDIERASADTVNNDNAPKEDKSENEVIERGHHHMAAEVVELNNLNVDVNADIVSENGSLISDDGNATPDISSSEDSLNFASTIASTPIDVTEDTKTTATIHLSVDGTVAGTANFQAGTLTGAHGSATLSANGTFVYTLDNAAAQHLNVGQSITDTISVKSAYGTSKDVTVTINGTNDLPTINTITAQSTNEDGSKVTGQLAVTDVDTSDTATYATSSTQAGFTLKSDGSYEIDPTDASFQHLAVGQREVVTIPVVATDSHSGVSSDQNIVVTVMGTNDIPVVSAPIVLAAGTEDKTQTITTAQLIANSTDVDSTDVLSVQKVTVDHGTVTTDTSGTVHFTPEANYNGKVIFSYEVTDSNGGVVATSATTDLAAVDDSIVDSGARDLGATKEDTATHFTEAQLLDHLTDADGALHVVAGSLSTVHGTITGDATKGYDFTPSLNYKGQDLDISYKVSDGTTEYTKTAQIDVGSVTDAAQVALHMSAIIPNAGGLVHLDPHIVTPVDTDDIITKVEIDGVMKGLVVSDGKHSVTVGHTSEKVNITGWDQTHLTVQLPAHIQQNMNIGLIVTTRGPDGAITVAQDHTPLMLNPNAPIPDATITGDSDKTTDDDTAVSGVLHVTDKDASQAHFDTKSVHGQYGQVTMNADGHWTFTPNATANTLSMGDTVKEEFTVHSADGTPHDITIHLTGSNEAPLISSAVTLGAGTEDTALTFTAAQLLANASDVDAKDSLSIKGPVSANHGSVTGPDVSGNYTFIPDANYNGAVKFTYDITDSHGGIVHTSASTSLANVVDTPTLTTTAATGDEDTAIALAINASTQAGDHISQYTITGLPTGTTLSAGHDNGHGSWTVVSGDIATLKMTPPANYAGDIQLQVTATATDGTQHVDSSVQTMSVHVNPIADMPTIDTLSVNSASGLPGAKILQLHYTVTLDQWQVDVLNKHSSADDCLISAITLKDATVYDISKLSFNGHDLPLGSRRYHYGDDTHILSDYLLSHNPNDPLIEFKVGDKITVEFNQGVNPKASIKAEQAHEIQSSDIHSYLAGHAYILGHNTFDRIADNEPFLKVTSTTAAAPIKVDEDGQFNLGISVSTPDKDGSETLEVHVKGIPQGATLNHGSVQTDGSYILTPAQLHGLQVLLPKNYNGAVDLDVSVISHDGTSTQTSPNSHIHVNVNSIVDAAQVALTDITTTEHTDWSALGLTAHAVDTQDPITNIVLRGLSANAELRLDPSFHGVSPVHNGDGSWTIDPASAGHLQIHTTSTKGDVETYAALVTTTNADGHTAQITATGHFTSNAVIEGHFTFNTAHTGIVSNVGELVSYHGSSDQDETASVTVTPPRGVTLVDASGHQLPHFQTTTSTTISTHYIIAVTDLDQAHFHSTTPMSNFNIKIGTSIIEGYQPQGAMPSLGGTSTALGHEFTGLHVHVPTPTLVIDSLTADNILNAQEERTTVAVTGKVSGDFHLGDVVTLVVNAIQKYTGTVDASGLFSIDVPGVELKADIDAKFEASITTSDGINSGTTTVDHSYRVENAVTIVHDEVQQDIDTDEVSIYVDSNDAIPRLGVELTHDTGTTHSILLPDHESGMINLENVAQQLETLKAEPAQISSDALSVVATMISDAQQNSKEAFIIKTVENQEEKAHVNNPNSPVMEHDGGHSDADSASTRGSDLAYDVHQSQDIQDDDGTGLT